MREKNTDIYYWLGFCLISLYSAAMVIYFGGRLDFTGDEYALLSLISSGGVSDMFSPYIGHLTVGSQLIYKAILGLFGSESYLPFQIAMIFSRVFLGAMVFIYAKKRTGPAIGIILAAIILFFNGDWLHALFGNGLIILLPLALGLMALNLFEIKTKSADVFALVGLLLAMTLYTTAVPFAIAVLVYAILYRRKDLWVPAVPLLLYGFWRIFIAAQSKEVEDGGINFYNLIKLPAWAFNQTEFTLSSLIGGAGELSIILTAIFFVLIAVILILKKDLEILVPLAGLFSLYAAQVIVSGSIRGSEEELARYLYPNIVFIALVFVFLIKPIASTLTSVCFASIALLLILININLLNQTLPSLEKKTITRETQLAAIKIAESAKPPAMSKDQPRGTGESLLRPGFNLKKASRWGNIGLNPKAFPLKNDRLNRALDIYLAKSYKPVLEKPEPAKIICENVSGKTEIPWSGLNIAASGTPEIRIGRFSKFAAISLGKLKTQSSLKIRPDSRPEIRWFFIARPGEPITICR